MPRQMRPELAPRPQACPEGRKAAHTESKNGWAYQLQAAGSRRRCSGSLKEEEPRRRRGNARSDAGKPAAVAATAVS